MWRRDRETAASQEAAAETAAAETAAAAEVGTYPIVEEPITVTGLVVGKDTATRSDRLVWNKVSEVTGINIEWEVIDADALATYLAGGDWPDFIHYNLDSSMVNDYGVVGGRFVNYLDYLDQMCIRDRLYGVPVSAGKLERLVAGAPATGYCVYLLEGHVLLSSEASQFAKAAEKQFSARLFVTDLQEEDQNVIIAFLKEANAGELEVWMEGRLSLIHI